MKKDSAAKNPTICKFMIQIGRYEELGSGVRKVNLYLPHYAPDAGKPVFEDGDMFKVVVPLGAEMTITDFVQLRLRPLFRSSRLHSTHAPCLSPERVMHIKGAFFYFPSNEQIGRGV